ncbi:MAG: hypothetical protein HY903_25075 [Deltaproteobacteria bacterium]|nr:hypothetical protein [Deltaproteobacteria bacterium]
MAKPPTPEELERLRRQREAAAARAAAAEAQRQLLIGHEGGYHEVTATPTQ